MNEIPQNPVVARDLVVSESSAPVANAKIEQAWLREFERAQWQQQRPADARRADGAPQAKGTPAAAQRAAPRPAAPAQSTEAWVASRASRTATAASGSAASRTPFAEE